ncbi:MAG: pyridoxamine 5'-phosphate oxidase family protein [Spirochaetes bacterium]|nr:pyridoxamine 5'-phosphate oxidase family protein [Spirochaetota bacterium]
MINFAEILKAEPTGVLATLDGDKVKTRVFQYLFADGNKAYFCTNSEKPVYAQLVKNPNVSFCSMNKYNPVLSINGKAVFTESLELKKKALDENPMIQTIYHSPDNPVFKIFYIDIEEMQTFSFDQGPKTY